MSAYLTALALAALKALGNFVDGLLAEPVHVSQRTLSLTQHTAASMILAVVGLALMPEARLPRRLGWSLCSRRCCSAADTIWCTLNIDDHTG